MSYGVTLDRITVLGGGSFGIALAVHLAEKHKHVALWETNQARAEACAKHREDPQLLPGVRLRESIAIGSDIGAALSGTQAIVIAVPSAAVREVTTLVRQRITGKLPLVICAAKGIELDTLALMSDVCEATLGAKEEIAYLSGPSFALEVAQGLPTSVVMAAHGEETATHAQNIVSMPSFRGYSSTDVIGVEIAGALKNVLAIAAGAVDGMGLGMNARAAMITRGLNEISRLGQKLGANPLTFLGLAGVGDLVLTCTGELSRNRRVGIALGKGHTLKQALAEVKTVAEGVGTAKAAHALAQKHGVDVPIIEAVYQVAHQGLPVTEALRALMSRTLKAEW
ncbi:MAG: NAD(P)-dependent glycerol-3-phosphate dehydrogenase [Deltaproteobacteria bacterium]|nr:NAD(P)-dependent glycerol-3-phosphate dehydrogenase [Deltaproteobacteria bacterium]